MKITVKLLGRLRRNLPAGAGPGGAEVDVAEGATPREVLNRLELPGERSYLILVNDESIPPSEYDSRKLEKGDLLTICPPLQGG